jgi:polysaccharide biosynthesis/export protein
MKKVILLIIITSFLGACTGTKNLSYLHNLPSTNGIEYFTNEIPDYRVQYRDILYIDVKAQTADGTIVNVFQASNSISQTYMQGEANQYLIGYNIDKEGAILLPVIGKVSVGGKVLSDVRSIVQHKVDSVFNHAFVEVKLLSFKFTVLGEVRAPGTFVNYNSYITILEALGHAGGITDFGRRDNILVIRSTSSGSETYRINLRDKDILSSKAYFLMPNDIVVVEPEKHKIFNMNLPTFSFIISSVTGIITTTLLLVNYFGK